MKKVLTVGKVKDDGSLGDSDLSVLKLSLEADNTAKKDDIIRLKEILATSRQSLANKKV